MLFFQLSRLESLNTIQDLQKMQISCTQQVMAVDDVTGILFQYLIEVWLEMKNNNSFKRILNNENYLAGAVLRMSKRFGES